MNICEIMGAKVADLTASAVTVELSDTPERVDLFERMLRPFSILVDIGRETLTISIVGDEEKSRALLDLLSDFGIWEIVRTGTIAIERGRHTIYDENKEKGEFDYGKNVL